MSLAYNYGNKDLDSSEDICDRCHSSFIGSNQFYNNNNIKIKDNKTSEERDYYPLNYPNKNQMTIEENKPQRRIMSQRDPFSISSNSTIMATHRENMNLNSMNQSTNIQPKSPIAVNYINDLKSVYDRDKEELQGKLYNLSKTHEITKSNLNDQLITLHNKLQETETQSRMDIKVLNDQYSFQLKRNEAEKDNQITMLLNKNNELTQCNGELLAKLDYYLHMINDTKINLTARISNGQCEVEHLNQELQRQKDYYEKKLAYQNSLAEDEKNKLVFNYDNTIEQLKQNYEESKTKFQKMIEARDNDIKSTIDMSESEHEKMTSLNSEYKKRIDELTEERIELIKENQNQKFDIEKLMTNLNQAKKETRAVLSEKIKYENQSDNLMRENGTLKIYNDKLNRLTHGKLKK